MKRRVREKLERREAEIGVPFEERLKRYAKRREVMAKRCAEWRNRQREEDEEGCFEHLPKHSPLRKKLEQRAQKRREEIKERLKELLAFARHVRDQRENGRWIT